MKAIIVHSLLLFWLSFVCATAQQDPLPANHSDDSDTLSGNDTHILPPEEVDSDEQQIDLPEIDISSSADEKDETTVSARTTVQGRTVPSDCKEGRSSSNAHYESPCEDNVVSDSDSLEGRTDSTCITSDGTFGNLQNDAGVLAVPLHYFYEMETIAGTETSAIQDEVLPALEKAIVDSILREVFPEKCSNTAFGKRNLRLETKTRFRRHLEVVGVSMYPPDYVTVDACDVLTGECSVVKGQLTMFTHEEEVVKEQSRIENLIEANMNSGVYNSVSDDIVQLYYLNGSPGTSESNINEGPDTATDIAKNKKGLKIGLYMGVGALVAILAGVLFRLTRKGRCDDDQTEIQSGIAQTYLDVDDQRPSFN